MRITTRFEVVTVKKDWSDLAPKFYWKTLRVLNYFAMNGPAHKGKIVRLIRPRVDKPTLYDAVNFLRGGRYIERAEKDRSKSVKWNGQVKLYRITPDGIRELLSRNYDVNEYKVTEKMILRILEKNPHLGFGDDWIRAFHAIRPFMETQVRREGSFVPWPSLLERVGDFRCLVNGGDAHEPRPILYDLVSRIVFVGEDAEAATATLQKLLQSLGPYPAYAKLVRELLAEQAKQANDDLQRAQAAADKINTVAARIL